MDITISGRKMNVTDALRNYADDKIGNATKVFDIQPMTVDVVLRVDPSVSGDQDQTCEVTVHVRGTVVRVTETESDMYAAIDLAADKVSRQLRKYKTKVIDARRGQGFDELNPVPEPDFEALAEELTTGEEFEGLIREKEIDFTLQSIEEALVQIDLLGHDFYVFTDENTGAVNVLYRRDNGGYGILKPRLEKPEE